MLAEIIGKMFLIFAVIDPIGSVPVYMAATKHFNDAKKKKIAIRACIIAFAVLLFFMIAGQLILNQMNVKLYAFQVSGGVVLFLFALTMIFGEGKVEDEKKHIKDYKEVTIFPLAIPSIASPGAILAVMILTDNNLYTITEQAVTMFLVFLVMMLTIMILLSAKYLQKLIGEYGITIISKIMGLILAAYAVQNVFIGVAEFTLYVRTL